MNITKQINEKKINKGAYEGPRDGPGALHDTPGAVNQYPEFGKNVNYIFIISTLEKVKQMDYCYRSRLYIT